MMKFSKRVLPFAALTLSLAVAGYGCSSDDGDDGGGGGGTADMGSAADAGGDGGSDDMGGGGDDMGGGGADSVDMPGAVSVCQNDTDKTYLTTDQGSGKTGRDLASDAASECGLGCLNAPDPKQCAIDCMLNDKGITLSDPCAGCYGQIVLCTIQECAAQCIADSSAPVCTDCQDDKGCTPAFYECTGPLD